MEPDLPFTMKQMAEAANRAGVSAREFRRIMLDLTVERSPEQLEELRRLESVGRMWQWVHDNFPEECDCETCKTQRNDIERIRSEHERAGDGPSTDPGAAEKLTG